MGEPGSCMMWLTGMEWTKTPFSFGKSQNKILAEVAPFQGQTQFKIFSPCPCLPSRLLCSRREYE